MKDISIIIVNYNVRYFIEQCLYSIRKAKKDLDIEIIVVDNNSIDNSVESIKENFPEVKLKENKKNTGFAKANNQAIKLVNSRYTLLLNPDTLVSEDTLIKAYDFMEKHPEAGALGVKLIDGEGKFLPESKRSVPTPMVSLFRLTGLSKLFPQSRLFNKYNLGFLDENETNEVDVLCGAFMFIRNEVFEKVGLLDEDFFMYGEDIDFSYRIRKAGYKIFYFPQTTTIHFKGESTKKTSVKYHHTFYKAMSIFARKHFGHRFFNFSLFFINIAIVGIGLVSYIKHNIKYLFLPIFDFLLYFLILFLFQNIWANYYHNDPDYYKNNSTYWFYALFSFISVLSLYLFNGYKRKYFINSIKGILTASVFIFVIYALLPESLRFSRAIIVFGACVSFMITLILRMAGELFFPSYFSQKNLKKKIAIVGVENEANKVLRIMDINRVKHDFAGSIYPMTDNYDHTRYIGDLTKLSEVIDLMKIDEIVFCLKNIEMNEVVNQLSEIGRKAAVKIFPGDTHGIIGSSDRNSRGEFYSFDISFRLGKSNLVMLKYFSDMIIALLLILLFPITMILIKSITFKDILKVISGRETWISYIREDLLINKLPNIKHGVFYPVIIGKLNELNQDEIHGINIDYATNFSVWNDLEIIYRNIIDNEKNVI